MAARIEERKMMFATNSQERGKKQAPLESDLSSKSTLSMLERAERVGRAFEASLCNKMTTLGQLLNRAELLGKKLQEQETLADAAAKKITALEELVARAEIATTRLQERVEAASTLAQKMADSEQVIRQFTASSALNAESRRQQEIIRLNAIGLPPREIADALEMHIGEVQLILSLKLAPDIADSGGEGQCSNG